MVSLSFLAKGLSGDGIKNLGYIEMMLGVGLLSGSIFMAARKNCNCRTEACFIYVCCWTLLRSDKHSSDFGNSYGLCVSGCNGGYRDKYRICFCYLAIIASELYARPYDRPGVQYFFIGRQCFSSGRLLRIWHTPQSDFDLDCNGWLLRMSGCGMPLSVYPGNKEGYDRRSGGPDPLSNSRQITK